MRAFELLDRFWDAIFYRLTRIFVWITGRSNYAFAHTLLAAGAALILLDCVGDTTNTGHAMGLRVFNGILIPVWTVLYAWRIRQYKRMEHLIEAAHQDGLLQASQLTWVFRFGAALMATLTVLLTPLLPGDPYWIGLGLFYASAYPLFHGLPGGKSVFVKAKSLLGKALSVASTALKPRVPVPVPI